MKQLITLMLIFTISSTANATIVGGKKRPPANTTELVASTTTDKTANKTPTLLQLINSMFKK